MTLQEKQKLSNKLSLYMFGTKKDTERTIKNMLYAREKLGADNEHDAFSFVAQSSMSAIQAEHNLTLTREEEQNVIDMLWTTLIKKDSRITKLFTLVRKDD